ncbi:hypothetical protein H4Q32_000503 [Labeo rohita]|uniref:Uncharacterized protein n=1 Tax=Labeo rohita TaxID=84645 RepID=A0ABQ8LKN9_LABRO|nr:hypothetical protein H4Q32_000503 [Labeo rohita]
MALESHNLLIRPEIHPSGCHVPPPSPTSSVSVLTIATLSPRIAVGLLVSIGVMAGASLVFASALQPSSSTMAPSSRLFTMARQSTSSAGLPRPSSSALVCCQPSAALGLHPSGYTSSLLPSGSTLAPPSLQLHLGPLLLRLHCGLLDSRIRLSHLSHLLHLGPPDLPHHPGSLALRLCLRLHHHLIRHHQSAPGVVSPFSTIAPLSIASTVGCHHGCGLGPAWLLPPSDPAWILVVVLRQNLHWSARLLASPLPSHVLTHCDLPPESLSIPPLVVPAA